MTQRELFFNHIAQTSSAPLALEIVKADGVMLCDADGKEYIDLIGGISVAHLGHRHPQGNTAIQKQIEAYLDHNVYRGVIETPQGQYAEMLTDHLTPSLYSAYVNHTQ